MLRCYLAAILAVHCSIADQLRNSRIRFVDEEQPFIGNPFQVQENYFSDHGESASVIDTVISSRSSLPAPIYQQVEEERWRWPSKSSEGRREGRQLRPEDLQVTRSVPKPYRVHTKESSCPKLLHDVSISCKVPVHLREPQQNVIFRWYKELHRNEGSSSNMLVEPVIRKAIAVGTTVLTEDSRYSVHRATSESATLTIRRLKSADCGSYVCEATRANGTTLAASDFLIFLCY